jgi:hypothetical protein
MNKTPISADLIIQDALSFADELKWFRPLDPLKEPVEPIDFVIDGFCAKGMVTIIGASAGAGKSILTQYLFSRQENKIIPTQSGSRAIYLTGADASETEIRRRARSIGANDGLLTVEMPDEMYCTATNETFMLELKNEVIRGGFNAVIFDTVADFHEGNTYEAQLVNKTMAVIRRFAKDTNSAVILITHTTKGSKIKSEYNVEDIADSRVFTSKSDFVFGIKSEYQDDSTNLIELQCLKSRSPKPLPRIRAVISYSHAFGLMIEPTKRSFRSELETQNKDSRKLANVMEAQRLKSQGKTVREIADTLGKSIGTVHGYLKADSKLVEVIHNNPDSYIDD